MEEEAVAMEATVHPTDLLRADHRLVMSKLHDLERVIGALTEPETVWSELKRLGSFFRRDIWALVWKEEDALFPEVVRSAPREQGAIRRFSVNHESLRGSNERFQNGLDGYLRDPGNEDAVARLRKGGQQIAALLRGHINEENSLLETAAARLDDAQKRRILERFETIDADLAWGFEQLEEFYP
jgi:hemerythrin-like domain-containing protein